MREECRGAERPVEDGPVIQPCNQGNEAGGEAQVVVAAFDAIGRKDIDPSLRGDLLDDPGAGIRGQGGDVVQGELQLGRKPRVCPGEEVEDRFAAFLVIVGKVIPIEIDLPEIGAQQTVEQFDIHGSRKSAIDEISDPLRHMISSWS